MDTAVYLLPRVVQSFLTRNIHYQILAANKGIEEFYRRTIFIPYLHDLLCSLKERFISHEDTIKSLESLAFDSLFSCLKPAVRFYEENLSGYQDIIEAEF